MDNAVDVSMYRVDQAARFLGVSRRMVYKLIWSGRIQTVRIGRAVRIQRADLESFVADNKKSTIVSAA